MTRTGRAGRSRLAFWAPAIAATVGIYVHLGDAGMFAIAQTKVMEEFGIQIGVIQLTLILVQVMSGPFGLIAGRLSDMKGKRRMFLLGAALYALGEILTGIAPNMLVLTLGYSVLRGVAMGLVITASTGLMIQQYREAGPRGRAFGIYGAGVIVAGVVPALYMGYAVDNLSWRLPFFLHALMFLGVFALVWFTVGEAPVEPGARLDTRGAVLAYLTIVPLLLAPTLARQYGWVLARRPFTIGGVDLNPLGLSPVAILLAFGTIMGLILLWWLEREEARGGEPLFRPSVFRNANFAGAIASIAVFYMIMSAFPFVLNNFLQGHAGWTALAVALVFAVMAVTSLISGLPSGRLLERYAAKYVLQGAYVVIAAGILWMLANVDSLDIGASAFVGPFLVIGLGAGIISSQANNIALMNIPPHRSSETSGVLELGKDVGLALGVALIGSILVSTTLSGTVDGVLKVTNVAVTPQERQALIIELEDAQASLDPGELQRALDELPPPVREDVRAVVADAPVKGFQNSLIGLVIAIVLAVVATFRMPAVRPSPQGADTP